MNFQPLRDFLDYYLPMLGVPGSDTAIYKNGEEVFRYQSGYDDLRLKTPVRPDAIYNIYSCTKVATVVAIMQLVERGEILVTDPLYAFIPEFREMRVVRKNENGEITGEHRAKTPITVKHLLTMTSGLNYSFEHANLDELMQRTEGRAPTLDVCRALAKSPLEFEPGEQYLYGLSHDILGGVIEVVSGMRLSEYMQKNIFEPLGMSDTSFHIDPTKISRLACQYEFDPVSRQAISIPSTTCTIRLGRDFDSAGAGLASTVDDYVLLADALANGGVGKTGNRIISEYSLDVMTANMLNEKQLAKFRTGLNDGYGYGYGVRVNMEPASVGNLAPVGDFGWDGKKLCYLSADREGKVAIFHAEHMGGLNNIVIPRLRNLAYACLGKK